MQSRVRPGSGPVSSRSSPRMRLSSVDLPAFGRPSTAMRSGLVGSTSLPSSSSPSSSGAGSSSSSGSSRAAAGSTSPQRVVEIARALAVLGGKRDRLAEAQRVGVVARRRAPAARLRLVGEQDDRPVGAAHGLREMPVGRGHAGARVDRRTGSRRNRRARLRSARACGRRASPASPSSSPAVSTTVKSRSPSLRLALAAVARHAGRDRRPARACARRAG